MNIGADAQGVDRPAEPRLQVADAGEVEDGDMAIRMIEKAVASSADVVFLRVAGKSIASFQRTPAI